jgi:hypothetical protein
LAPLLRNKAIFYRFCLAQSIPVPALYAIGFGQARNWTHHGPIPGGTEPWLAFLEHELPAEFVIKPVEGAFGQGVRLFRRQNGILQTLLQRAFLRRRSGSLFAVTIVDGFLIQERLRNHPRRWS